MKKWLMMLAVLVTFCLVGCGEKPMTAVYFQADDNSWYFADLDTGTIFSGTIPDKLTDENGKKLTEEDMTDGDVYLIYGCLLYTSPSPRDRTRSRMPSSA